jgi:hypothetical protein
MCERSPADIMLSWVLEKQLLCHTERCICHC